MLRVLYFYCSSITTTFLCAVANQTSQFCKKRSRAIAIIERLSLANRFAPPKSSSQPTRNKQTNISNHSNGSAPDRQHCTINYTAAVLLPFSPPAPSKTFLLMSSNDSNRRSSRRVSRACARRSLSAGAGVTSRFRSREASSNSVSQPSAPRSGAISPSAAAHRAPNHRRRLRDRPTVGGVQICSHS